MMKSLLAATLTVMVACSTLCAQASKSETDDIDSKPTYVREKLDEVRKTLVIETDDEKKSAYLENVKWAENSKVLKQIQQHLAEKSKAKAEQATQTLVEVESTRKALEEYLRILRLKREIDEFEKGKNSNRRNVRRLTGREETQQETRVRVVEKNGMTTLMPRTGGMPLPKSVGIPYELIMINAKKGKCCFRSILQNRTLVFRRVGDKIAGYSVLKIATDTVTIVSPEKKELVMTVSFVNPDRQREVDTETAKK